MGRGLARLFEGKPRQTGLMPYKKQGRDKSQSLRAIRAQRFSTNRAVT